MGYTLKNNGQIFLQPENRLQRAFWCSSPQLEVDIFAFIATI